MQFRRQFLLLQMHAKLFTKRIDFIQFHTENKGGTRENKGEWFGMMYLLGAIRRL